MSNGLEKGFYVFEKALPGWTKVHVLNYDEEYVFVELVDEKTDWSLGQTVFISRDVFEYNFKKVD